MAEKEPKRGLTPRQTFWARFVLWVLFACVLPVAFIIYRFDLFSAKPSIGGWGIIVVLIITIFGLSLIGYVRKGLKFSLLKQIINGVCRVVLPLLAITLILNCIKNEIELMLQVMVIITACETIAIPLNPLPQWAYDNRNEEIESIFDLFWSKKKKDGEE